MTADCPACVPAADDVREPSRARARVPWRGLVPAVLYALAPKCPMCLVGYLSAFGVTVGMASVALSVIGPLAAVSVVFALGWALRRAKVPGFRLPQGVGTRAPPVRQGDSRGKVVGSCFAARLLPPFRRRPSTGLELGCSVD